MINNNMDMIKQMENLFDYEEYASLCEAKDIHANDMQQFFKGMGFLSGALYKYPAMDWQEAYNKIFKDMDEQDSSNTKKEIKVKKKLPSLIKRALNYADNQARWVQSGKPVVDEETYLHRLAVCGVDKDVRCDNLNDDDICIHPSCGCPMKKKAKRDMENLCALNKW